MSQTIINICLFIFAATGGLPNLFLMLKWISQPWKRYKRTNKKLREQIVSLYKPYRTSPFYEPWLPVGVEGWDEYITPLKRRLSRRQNLIKYILDLPPKLDKDMKMDDATIYRHHREFKQWLELNRYPIIEKKKDIPDHVKNLGDLMKWEAQQNSTNVIKTLPITGF